MEPILCEMTLKRFRSVLAERVAFSNPTFFVGQNGSGKSNFVNAFAFLAEAMTSPLQAVFDRRGGISHVRNRTSGRSFPPNLGLGVRLRSLNGDIRSARYAFELKALPKYGFQVVREQCVIDRTNGRRDWFDRKGGRFSASQSGWDPAPEPNALAFPLLGGDARLSPVFRFLSGMRVYSIEPARLREMQDPDSGTTLRFDGGNAASVLQEIERQAPDELTRICELLEAIVPKTTRVSSKKHGNKLSLEFTQEWSSSRPKFDAFDMSDGTLRALGLLLAVYQKPSPGMLIVEEPESTIHPGALSAVLDVIRHASRSMQVIVTTHSPELLEAKWITDEHLRVVGWKDGATFIAPVSEATRDALREHLMGAGELLRSNALTPELFDDRDLSILTLFDKDLE